MANIKVLCIHGIGGKDRQDRKEKWQTGWSEAFEKMNFTNKKSVSFMEFDNHFQKQNADWSEYKDFFRTAFFPKHLKAKGEQVWSDDFPDMVVEFLQDKEQIRATLREVLKNDIATHNPDVIYAHSLGSLMCYDFFSQPENDHYQNIILVTSGSQLGNPLLKNHQLRHPIQQLPVKFWFNLNNPMDMVFARHSLDIDQSKQFQEISTFFLNLPLNHNGLNYLEHYIAKKQVWQKIKQIMNNH